MALDQGKTVLSHHGGARWRGLDEAAHSLRARLGILGSLIADVIAAAKLEVDITHRPLAIAGMFATPAGVELAQPQSSLAGTDPDARRYLGVEPRVFKTKANPSKGEIGAHGVGGMGVGATCRCPA
jgi:hypothetical protein